MIEKININVPKGWTELSQEQLRFLFKTMAEVNFANGKTTFRSQDDYVMQTSAQVATKCFFEWAGLRLVCPYNDDYLVSFDGNEFTLSLEVIVSAIRHLSWLDELPTAPVRLDSVDGAKAVVADLSSGFPFDSWLACENLWQCYQMTQDETLLRQMAEILYNKDDIRLDAAETLSIFYWWGGVKAMVSTMFPDFFKPASGDGSAASYDDMRRNVDSQIRALTRGDIAKEHEILQIETMRALTELDAQAREYDELNKKYGN